MVYDKIERTINQMKKKIALIGAIAFLVLFLVFTVLVITVDVQPIGPNGSEVGLATMNGAVADALEYNEIWYNISDYAGYLALLIPVGFALLGLFQVIKRKSLLKVDRHLIILAVFYVAVLCAYITFEIFKVNYRPILVDGVLEASYPSSHTLLSLCITASAIFEAHLLLKSKKVLLISADILFATIGAVVLVGRLLSGVHWLSDIMGGVLLSGALVCFFVYAVLLTNKIAKRKQKENKENTVND